MMPSLLSRSTMVPVARQVANKSGCHRFSRSSALGMMTPPPGQLSSLTTRSTAVAIVQGSSQDREYQRHATSMKAAALLLATAASTMALTGGVPDPTTTALDNKKLPTLDIIPATVKEKSTGIVFPQLCNGMSLVGCGVRIKWGFVKVYAVGTYMDPVAMSAIKSRPKEEIEAALLDPMYPRTIRLVMARNLSIEKYTNAIVEALEPRMKGQDKEQLEEFKKLNPPVDLVEGAVIEMTIRGDTMLYKNATGGFGAIHSKIFTQAMCDVYYGKDPVSPTHKEDVLKGIPNIQ